MKRVATAAVAAMLAALGAALLFCDRSDLFRIIRRAPQSGGSSSEIVVFILIDALRRDHLGVYAYTRNTSPTIDRLAKRGLFLANVVAHSSQTVPSVLSLWTSQPPHRHGVQYRRKSNSFVGSAGEDGAPLVAPELRTMAERFAEAGYHTAAVVANPWLQASLGFAQGFKRYVEIPCSWDGVVCDGRRVNTEARRILMEQRREKTFLYLHYMDVHSPYVGNEAVPRLYRPARGKYTYRNGPVPNLSAEDLRYTIAAYDERIRWIDGLIAQLLRFLNREGLDEDITVVITSDHGDEFHEHGGLGHGTTLYNELVRSFAIMWNPRRLESRRVDNYVAGIDVLPTLLALQALPMTEDLAGTNVLEQQPPAQRIIVSELAEQKAVVGGRWKLLFDRETAMERLYNVDRYAAIETPDRLVRRSPPLSLREAMSQVVRLADRNRADTVPLRPETAEQLRALGYLE